MKILLPVFALLFAVSGAARAGSGEASHFVSLKADEVFMREGPSKEHRIKWVYRRKGLPVQVLAAFDVWRRIRDQDGEVGWVHRSMLSSDRTALVTGKGDIALRAQPGAGAGVVAQVQAGAIGELRRCQARACEVSFGDLDGWIDRARLWGVDAGEPTR